MSKDTLHHPPDEGAREVRRYHHSESAADAKGEVIN